MTATPHTITTAVRVADYLYSRPGSKRALTVSLRVSMTTAQRALTWLREVAGAPLTFDVGRGTWSLAKGWRMSTALLPANEIVRQLRAMLECDDVIAEVRALVLADLGAAAE